MSYETLELTPHVDQVSRMCQLIVEIAGKRTAIEEAEKDFYAGGHSFNELHEQDIKELEEKCAELRELVK